MCNNIDGNRAATANRDDMDITDSNALSIKPLICMTLRNRYQLMQQRVLTPCECVTSLYVNKKILFSGT